MVYHANFVTALCAKVLNNVAAGNLNIVKPHCVDSDVLFQIWRSALCEVLHPSEKRAFLALTDEEQQNFFGAESLFSFLRFLSEFMESVRKKEEVILH